MTSVAEQVAQVPTWYHTIDVGSQVTTPGWFDLRPVVDRFPWPDVRGRRCLDVGTYDGFLAFELERRGAREVIATDIEDHADWDWLPRERAHGPDRLAAGGSKGQGFEVARGLLGSTVQREWCSVYDLHPDHVGVFDVVVCGALLLHLRDPIRALEAIRSVTGEAFLSIEQVDPISSVWQRNRPMAHLRGQAGQWSIPNTRGHRHLLHVAGLEMESSLRLVEPFGVGHPPRPPGGPALRAQRWIRAAHHRIGFGRRGLPVQAVLARPVDVTTSL